MTKNRERDALGRFVHSWGWQGFDAQGREWLACECCERWRVNGRTVAKAAAIPALNSGRTP